MQISTKVGTNPAYFKHIPLFLLIINHGSTFEYRICLLDHDWFTWSKHLQ